MHYRATSDANAFFIPHVARPSFLQKSKSHLLHSNYCQPTSRTCHVIALFTAVHGGPRDNKRLPKGEAELITIERLARQDGGSRPTQADSSLLLLLPSSLDRPTCLALHRFHAEPDQTASPTQWSREGRSQENGTRQTPAMGNGARCRRVHESSRGVAIRVSFLDDRN